MALRRLPPFVLSGFGNTQFELFDEGVRLCDFCPGDGDQRRGFKEFCAGADHQRLERLGVVRKGLE